MLMISINLGLTSCIMSEDPYIDIIAVTSCSPDLLEFVTPIVEIIGENGENQRYELTAKDFSESEEGGSISIKEIINGQQSTKDSTVLDNIARNIQRFDDVESIKGNISVSYSLKPNYSLNKDTYVFFHKVNYRYNAQSKEGIELKDIGVLIKPTAYQISKQDVESYLTNLSSNPDETSFNVSVPQPVK